MAILKTQVNTSQPLELFEFTHGIDLDKHIAKQEVAVQIAWANALLGIGILGNEDVGIIEQSLKQAEKEIANDTFEWRAEDEDIHMHLERYITDKHGDLGKKMHIGRSRNDLIATTLRLHTRDTLTATAAQLKNFILALVDHAENNIDTIIPGFTHLQAGQPVRYAHIILSHAMAFYRDIHRITATAERTMNYMPLGSAALAGTHLNIDLAKLAKKLGFKNPSFNSYDAVSDRDFMVEALETFAAIARHLSRFAEDIIYWASSPVGLIKLPPNWSTGSSIMPNKRNPDVCELTRAKSAHVIAAATNAQILIKGLPTSYNSDMHELKRTYIYSYHELEKCLKILPLFTIELEVNEERAQKLVTTGHILATEIANHLTEQGMAFREAYKAVAALVELANNQELQVHELSQEDYQSIAPELSKEFMKQLDYETTVESRQNDGGTAKKSVEDFIRYLKHNL